MKKFFCAKCNFIYDQTDGNSGTVLDMDVPHGAEPDEVFFDRDAQMTPPGASFASLPADWVCPQCGCAKADFHPAD